MKTTTPWIGRVCAMLALALFIALPQSHAQATPPTGMPVQYAAPFGVLTWINAEYAGNGVGRWEKITSYGLTATLTPNEGGQLDDQGNPYFALLDFQNSANTQNNAQYFAYVGSGSTSLSLRLKPGSAGTSPFPEIASAVFRDVLAIGTESTRSVEDGGGYGGGYVYWHYQDYKFYISDNGGGLTDAAGNLFFGYHRERLQYDIENEKYAYLDSSGSFNMGAVLQGWVGGLSYPHIVPAGMENTYFSTNGVTFTWHEESDGWSGWLNDYQGASYGFYFHMTGAESGVLIVSYYNYNWSSPETFYLSVTLAESGVLTVHGTGVGALTEGAILMPASMYVSVNPPILTFQYNGQTYRVASSSPLGFDQTFTYYQTIDGSNTAQIMWDTASKAITMFSIWESSGGYASYTSNGSGGYTWDPGSTAENALTQVNGMNFVPDGSSSAPAAVTQFSGDLDMRGNLLSLGSWNGDWSQAGLNLTYQDGDSAINSALAIWTASRAHTAWLWEHVNEEGGTPNTKPQMKLGSDNVLTLYKTDGTVGITINPNTGRIRVAPQGDLSMGAFVQEPTAP